MTLIESTSEQLIKDFSTFVVPSDSIKHIAVKNVIVHLNKVIDLKKYNHIKYELEEQQLDYLKEKYK